MKNAAWLEDDKKVVNEFPCLLGRPVPEELRGHKLVAVMSHKVNIIVNNVQVLLFHVFVLLVLLLVSSLLNKSPFFIIILK